MSESFKIEWIPKLLDSILCGTDLEEEIIVDIKSAIVLLQEKNLKTQKKKEKKMKKKSKKRKNAPPYRVTLIVKGGLPHNLSVRAFRSAVLPLLEDCIFGEVTFLSCNRMNNGTFCYSFQGMCPIHLRHHTDVGPWQIKQHPNHVWCGYKCWKNDSYKKMYSIPTLCDF